MLPDSGTNVDEAKQIIGSSGFKLTMAAGFEDAAKQAVSLLSA